MDVLDQILLVVSAVAAVAAAIYAFRGDRFSRATSEQAAEQRKLDIQPRLTVTWQGAMANGYKIIVGNAGGAARLYWVGTDASVFATCRNVPAHNGYLLVGVTQVGNVRRAGLGTIIWLAEDIQGSLYGMDGRAVTISAASYIRTELQKAGFTDRDQDTVIEALGFE